MKLKERLIGRKIMFKLKKLIILGFVVLLFHMGKNELIAQTNLSSYEIYGKQVNVAYEVEKKDKYDMWIDIVDESHTIRIPLKDLPKAKTFFINSFDKVKEWAVIAKENDVKDVRREIDKAKIGNLLGFKYGSWQFALGSVEIQSSMRITEDGTPYCMFIIPKKKSSGNRYIESETQILMFGLDNDEFASFIKHFDQEYTKKLVDEYNSKSDIFDNR
jgi:hypothetical protein